jgi:Zn-dependent metalloprotease
VRRMVMASAIALTAIAAIAVAIPNASAKQTPASPDALAVAAADRATSADAVALAKGPQEAFVRGEVLSGAGGLRYVSYERTYQGLTVVGGDAVVVTDSSGHVLSTASAMAHPLSMPSVSAMSVAADRADVTAVAAAQGGRVVGAPRKVVLARDTAKLAWETIVEGSHDGIPSRVHVFVDASTGAVLDSYDEVKDDTGRGFYNGTVTINTTVNGTSHRLIDPTRPGLSCAQTGRQPFTNTSATWGNASGTDLKTGCVDAFYAVEQETNMLKTWLGRNGLNGNGREFPLFVGLNEVNAFWNGSSGNFGHSQDNKRQATNIDVVAHEMGHSIFQFTPGGAGSGRENGGLNEGTGDIFGALTEAFANNPNDPPDYTVGEEVNLVGNGPIRFMYNPSLRNQPNCFATPLPADVHAGAGPLNHWFYLVAEGSKPAGKPASPTCNNSTVTGITIRKAGMIYMGALMRKTSTWKYANVRVATLQAARQLFPNGCTEFNTVKAAWNAVSVPAQSGEPTCA